VGGKLGGKRCVEVCIAKTDVYHDEVQAKVRRDDPSQTLFELANSYFLNKDKRRSSLTRIMSKDQINASRAKATVAMQELHDLPSREKKRAYKLKHFNLSELVSNLWWLNKKDVDSKALTAGK
jgi:hypothetical protein